MNQGTIVDGSDRIGLAPGTQLNELFEVDSLIAVGGMGEVYRGHVVETGDAVAIKIIRPDFAGNINALALLRKEAAALHTIQHEAVVRYYVFSIDRRLNLPYFVMEYVAGEPLAKILERGPLTFESIDILRQRLASGLQAAHAVGVIHRDVSPDNVILPTGHPAQAKIIDFGIARSLLAEETVIGDGFAGKYNYVSPEQLGLEGRSVTPKSDIYSLGLVLAQASLGHPLDMGSTPAEFVSKRTTIPDLTGVDPRLTPLLEIMLRPDPCMRPASMADVVAWRSPLQGQGTEAHTAKGGPKRKFVIGGVAGVLALSVGMAITLPHLMVDRNKIVRPPGPPNGGTNYDPGSGGRDAAENAAIYIRGYQGGSCFFLNPLTLSEQKAVIEAYGSTVEPFTIFDADFKITIGLEADIQLRQVDRAQCPVVDLLAQQATHEPSSLLKLQLDRDRIQRGEKLNGVIEHSGDQILTLLRVDSSGVVRDLTADLIHDGQQLRFTAGVSLQDRLGPQLLVAISSKKPLTTRVSDTGSRSEAIFQALSQEANRPDTAIKLAVRYVKVRS